jgi:SAM-dependent methyltransferase
MLKLNIFTGALEDAEFDEESFNLILIIASIDHLLDPLDTLKRLLKLCKPGGYLFIDTYDSLRLLSEGMFFPKMDHCYYFTGDTIHSLVSTAGWEIVKFGRFTKFPQPFDFPNVSNRYKDIVVSILARKSEVKIPTQQPDGKQIVERISSSLRWYNRLFMKVKVIFRTCLRTIKRFYCFNIKKR